MDLLYKPDFDRASLYWKAFWEREIIDRPCICVYSPKAGVPERFHVPYMAGHDGRFEDAMQMYEKSAASTYFGGEAIPYFEVTFGPDQFSAFLGAELTFSETTSWVKPFVSDWKSFNAKANFEKNEAWERLLRFMEYAAGYSDGKFLIGMLDLHSNMDCLSALRGPENLCMDIMDCPDEVEGALNDVRALYAPIYEKLYEKGNMKNRGCIGWASTYCEEKFAVVQCDFICMLSPEQARRFVIPAIAEETSYLDHNVYHYDGKEALRHLDDILAIPGIDVIQWVPGAGQPKTFGWMDLLKKIQKAGKRLWIYDWTAEEIRQYHRELRPEGIVYHVNVDSEKEAEDLILWLKKNT